MHYYNFEINSNVISLASVFDSSRIAIKTNSQRNQRNTTQKLYEIIPLNKEENNNNQRKRNMCWMIKEMKQNQLSYYLKKILLLSSKKGLNPYYKTSCYFKDSNVHTVKLHLL